VESYVRAQLPGGMVLDITIPRTSASVESFAAGQPLVLRTPEDSAAIGYTSLAARLRERLS
jgi:chromosome partitioning protein